MPLGHTKFLRVFLAKNDNKKHLAFWLCKKEDMIGIFSFENFDLRNKQSIWYDLSILVYYLVCM